MSRQIVPQSLLDQIPKLGESEMVADPIVRCRLFHPLADWNWYVIEYDPASKTYFGLVFGTTIEVGYFSEVELLKIEISGIGIECDRAWKERPLSKVLKA